MSQVYSKIERAGLSITGVGIDIKAMLADGRIDEHELAQLERDADELLQASNVVEDVALDIQQAIQDLRLGRENTPTRRLQERDRDLRAVLDAIEPPRDMEAARLQKRSPLQGHLKRAG